MNKRFLYCLFVALLLSLWVVFRPASRTATPPAQADWHPTEVPAASVPFKSTLPAQDAPPTARVLPAADGSTAPASDLADVRSRDRLLAGAEVIEEQTTPPDAGGRFSSRRIVKADFKYPLLRIEETWSRDPATGTASLLAQTVMVADHLLVTLREGVPAAEFADAVARLGGKVRRQLPNAPIYLVATANATLDGFDTQLAEFRRAAELLTVVEPDYLVFAMHTPDDPSFALEWGLHNVGQTGGTGDADIDATEAWDVTRGSTAVVVGVIDTGVDTAHPDLTANLWHNAGETPGNGVDDDGNGYIDDIQGWNFVSENNNPADDDSHGTHCAGTIGAVGGNGLGVAGVCHTVRLMPLKTLAGSGAGTVSDATEAVRYATANHATLTSNSWGGDGYSQTLKNAIDAAGSAGQLFVAAAGNSGQNTDLYPAYPAGYSSAHIVAVAATDHADLMAGFSNFGAATVDLAAPGVAIYSTFPGGGYAYSSGTSMACPHVAGACALLKAANPAMTWQDLKTRLLGSVDAIPVLAGKVATGGRLNVANMLTTPSGAALAITATQFADDGQAGSSGNGDGIPNPGEDLALSVSWNNRGSGPANGLTATLVVGSADPKITVIQGTRVLGNLPAGGTVSTGEVPFLIRIAPEMATPHAFTLYLTITDTSGQSWSSQLGLTALTPCTVAGRVAALTGGAAIPTASVTYTGKSSGSVPVTADGTYIANLTDGVYHLRATAPGYTPSAAVTVTVPPNATAVDFALGRPTIQATPSSLAATQLEDSVTTQSVIVTNTGDSPLTFTATFVPGSGVESSADSTLLPFIDGFESGALSGWAVDGTGRSEIVAAAAAVGAHCFHQQHTAGKGYQQGIHRELAGGSQPSSISFWIRPGSATLTNGCMSVRDRTYGKDLIQFAANSAGKFSINNGVGGDTSFAYQANQWYWVEFGNIDWLAKQFDYRINGALVKARIPFLNRDYVDEASQLWLYNFSTGAETWWDDVRVTDIPLDWLATTPRQATVAAGQSVVLEVTFDARGQLAGEYAGRLNLNSNDPLTPVLAIPTTLTVQALPNTPPVANAQTVTLTEDSRAVITLTGSDADDHSLAAWIRSLPAAGTLHQTTDGVTLGERIAVVPAAVIGGQRVIFVPAPNGNGTPYAEFQFSMRDPRSLSEPAAVTLNVTAEPDAPVALDDIASALPGAIISPIAVLQNDFEPDGQPLTITSFTQGGKGTVAANGDGTLSFTPQAAFTAGEDSFTYTIGDGAGGSATATVRVGVGRLAAGPWPMLGGDAGHTGHYPATLDGQTFSATWTLAISTRPLNHPASAEGKVFVTPNPTFDGEARLCAVDLATGTLMWQKDWPDALAMSGPAYQGGSLYVQRKADSKLWALNAADGATRWGSPVTGYGYSTPSLLPPTVTETSVFICGNVNGTIHGGIHGFDRSSGAPTFFATLEPYSGWTPSALGGEAYSFVGGQFRRHHPATGATLAQVNLGNFHEGGIAVMTATAAYMRYSSELVCVDLATPSVRWRVSAGIAGIPAVAGSQVYAYAFDGSVKAFDIASGALLQTYVTNVGGGGLNQPIITNDALIATSATSTAVHSLATGTKLQTIAAGGLACLSNGFLLLAGTDGSLRCFAVQAGNTAPVAQNLTATCVEDQAVTLSLPGTDPQNDALGAVVTSLPAQGTLYQTLDGSQPAAAIVTVPAVVLHPGRKVIYVPPPDASGMAYATFNFKVNDGRLNSSQAAVTVNVTPVNDRPIAVADTAYLRPGNLLPVLLPTANDIDADGDPLQIASFTQPANGTVAQNADGSLRYTPAAGFSDGTDTFQYVCQDGAGEQATGTVQILMSTLHGREWTQFGNGPGHPGRYPGTLGTQPWVQRWEAPLGSINPLAIGDGKVFVASGNPNNGFSPMIALDQTTGAEVWRTWLTAGTMDPPSYHRGAIFLRNMIPSNNSRLLALDAVTGATLWNRRFDSQLYSNLAPAVSDLGLFAAAGINGGFGGYNYRTGAEKFSTSLNQTDYWTPAIHDGEVYTFIGGLFRCHHPETGAEQWRVELPIGNSYMHRTICCDGDRAYLTNDTNPVKELVCIDLKERRVRWRVKGESSGGPDGSFHGTPAIANGIVYACRGGRVQAFNSSTGQWLADYLSIESFLSGNPVVSNDLLFIGNNNTRTHIFDLATRALVQTLPFAAHVAIADDVVYLACADLVVRAFGRDTPGNHPPVALAGNLDIPEDAEFQITLEGTDPDNEPLSYVLKTLPTTGSLYQTPDGVTKGAKITVVPAQVIHPSGTLICQLPPNSAGPAVAAFSFTANDRSAASAPAAVTINIIPANDPPVAVPDEIALRPGESLLHFRPEANDQDPDADTLQLVRFTQGTAGQVMQDADGSLRYVPGPGLVAGTDHFTYTIRDAAGIETEGTVSITVDATAGRTWPTFGAGPEHTGFRPIHLGSAPFALRWQFNLGAAPAQLAVADGRVIASFKQNLIPNIGNLVALETGSGGEFWRADFSYPDFISPPTWFDGGVFVHHAKGITGAVRRLDAASGTTSWSAPLAASYPSLASAVDESGAFLSGNYLGGIYGFSTATGTQTFGVTYNGSDQWTPTLHRGGLYAFARGIVRQHDKSTGAELWRIDFGRDTNANSSNRTPACANGRAYLVNDSVTMPAREQELICLNLDTHAVEWKRQGLFTGTPAVAHQAVFVIANGNTIKSYNPATGDLIGTYALPAPDTGLAVQPIVTADTLIASTATATYLFDLGTRALRQTIPYGGPLSLAGDSLFIASDNGIIRAYGLPDPLNTAPVAMPLAASTPEDTRVTLTLAGSDANGDPLRFVITSLPAAGTLYQTADAVEPGAAITTAPFMVANPAGNLIYQPPPNLAGDPLATFQFAATDGNAPSAAATATIRVLAVNDPPLARADYRVARPGQTLSPVGEKDNDLDHDGDALTTTSFTQPALGTVSRNADGTLLYQAPANVAQGVDTFRYTVADPAATTATTTVTIQLTPDDSGEWPTFGKSPAHTGCVSAALGRTGWTRKWIYTDPGLGSNLQSAAGGNGRVFVSYRKTDSRLVALDLATGTLLWSSAFPSASTVNPPTYHNDRVYFQRCGGPTDTQLIAVRADTGATVWQAGHASGYALTTMAPAASDLGVFVNGGSSGGLFGFTHAGAQLFYQPKPTPNGWTPAMLDSELYVLTKSAFVRHHPVTGVPLWSLDLGWGGGAYLNNLGRTTALDNRRAYLVNDSPTTTDGDEDLICINLDAGAMQWSVNGEFTGTPAVSGGLVFVISGNTVQARTAADGSLVATYAATAGHQLTGQPVVTDDLVIACTGSKTFVFGRHDQVLLATLASGGAVAVMGNALIISNSTSGSVSAWTAQPALTFNPPGGSFGQPVEVTLTAADPTATIHYTLDGTAPGLGSPALVSGSALRIAWTGLIRAIAVKDSAVSSIHDASFSLTDSDHDDLPDWWETQTFTNLTAASASSDADRDGASDAAEFIAGTDPNNPSDTFVITAFAPPSVPGGQVRISWSSKIGRQYTVETSADFEGWQAVGPSLAGTGGIMTRDLPAASLPNRFARVKVAP